MVRNGVTTQQDVMSAQDLVDSLLAGDKLVVVGFFSPGCGGCRALHSKLCHFAEQNPNIQFLQIKKFRDALTKHTPDRCCLGPTKGLEEKELVAFAANKDLSFKWPIQLPAPSVPVDDDDDSVSIGSTQSQSDLPYRMHVGISLETQGAGENLGLPGEMIT